jgi:hypothetical protein
MIDIKLNGGYAANPIGSNLNAFFSSFTGLSNILPISFMAFTKTTNWFAPTPLLTTNLRSYSAITPGSTLSCNKATQIRWVVFLRTPNMKWPSF